jgi:uncharacterized protein YjbJ (UPF0337 family)
MNSTEPTGDWEQQKEELKQKFAALTDDDVFFTVTQKEEMIEKLQIKLGKTKEEILKIIQSI